MLPPRPLIVKGSDNPNTPTLDRSPLQGILPDTLPGGLAAGSRVVPKWRRLDQFDPKSKEYTLFLNSLLENEADRKATTSLEGEDAALVLEILAKVCIDRHPARSVTTLIIPSVLIPLSPRLSSVAGTRETYRVMSSVCCETLRTMLVRFQIDTGLTGIWSSRLITRSLLVEGFRMYEGGPWAVNSWLSRPCALRKTPTWLSSRRSISLSPSSVFLLHTEGRPVTAFLQGDYPLEKHRPPERPRPYRGQYRPFHRTVLNGFGAYGERQHLHFHSAQLRKPAPPCN